MSINSLEYISGSYQPFHGDISNGFYPHLKKVGVTSPEFLDVVSWLVSKGAPVPKISVVASQELTGPGKLMPTELVFANSQGVKVTLDAALVFNFPHVALTELESGFEFGDPNTLQFYPGYDSNKYASTTPSPIGAFWPEEAYTTNSNGDKIPAQAFRPSPTDKLPEGSRFSDTSGTYHKILRRWVFVQYPVWIKE